MTSSHRSSKAFKDAMQARIRNRARDLGRPSADLLSEFFMQRFLARIFAAPDSPWVVTGGGGLLVRIPGARHSQDIDLIHLDADLDQAVRELQALSGPNPELDPFTFDISVKAWMQGAAEGARLTSRPYLGTRELRPFPIDLAIHRTFIGPIDYIAPAPVIDIDEVAALPKFALFPLADQIADKVSAMYELHGPHGTTPSTRYRDLADLLFLTGRFPLNAKEVRAAFDLQSARRGITLPTRIQSPGPTWTTNYLALAKTTTLPRELHTLDNAIAHLGECLNPLLDDTVSDGTWDPATRSWDV